MGQQLKHQKRRNVGLVYEVLVREVTAAVIAEDRDRAARATNIIQEHLAPGTLLGEELIVHQSAIGHRGCGSSTARRIVDELRAAGIRLSTKRERRDRAKTGLIHEINRSLGKDCFDRHRIPDYTAHASIGLVLGKGLGQRLDEGMELVRVEEALVSWLAASPSAAVPFDRDATTLAYRNAIRVFEEEIGQELTGPQRELLRERVRTDLGGNPAPLTRLYGRQRSELLKFFEGSRSDEAIVADEQMRDRLQETIVELRSPAGPPDEQALERLMLMHEIRRHIES